MKKKKIPLRKCIGCNEQKPKQELIRVVKSNDDEISIDFTGKAHGRGAYICADIECLKKAEKKKLLNKSFKQQVNEEVYNKLYKELESSEG